MHPKTQNKTSKKEIAQCYCLVVDDKITLRWRTMAPIITITHRHLARTRTYGHMSIIANSPGTGTGIGAGIGGGTQWKGLWFSHLEHKDKIKLIDGLILVPGHSALLSNKLLWWCSVMSITSPPFSISGCRYRKQ